MSVDSHNGEGYKEGPFRQGNTLVGVVTLLVKMPLGSHRHGKTKVRVARVWRDGNRHTFREWSVDIMLESDMAHAYTTGSNEGMTATDTMKNTVGMALGA